MAKEKTTTEEVEESSPSAAELSTLNDELQKAVVDFRTINDAADVDRKEFGETLGEFTERLEKAEAAIVAAEVKIEKVVKLPQGENDEDSIADRADGSRKDNFWLYSRKGLDFLTVEQKATMIVGDDTTGGYLAPPEFVQEIIKGVVEQDPLRALAKVRQTSSRMIQYPKRSATGQVFWTGAETDTYQETGPRYALENIPVHEMSAVVPVSNQDLEDSAFDLEGELRENLIEQFAVGEGTAFVVGTGVAQPEGFINDPDIETIKSGTAGVVEADGLMDIFYALKELYAANATWLMQRSVLKEIRKLKETSTDNYLWQPGLAGSQPATILGAPYAESPSMPSIGTDAKSIAVGDFGRGYLIADRLAIAILRDGFSAAKKGVVEFIARKRVGGQVILAEAIKIQPLSV